MIFVDTGFLVALAQPSDALHARALAWAQRIDEPLMVTEYVLLETVNHLSKLADRVRGQRLVLQVRSDPAFELVPASTNLFESGLKLHRERNDKEWSLTDCISFQLMRQRDLSRALAFDAHFEQAGFEALLQAEPPE